MIQAGSRARDWREMGSPDGDGNRRLRRASGRALTLGLLGGLALAALAAWPVLAVSFRPEPVIGDRRVELSWAPDADDPYYNGNTVLNTERRFDTVHGTDRAVRLLVSNIAGTEFFSWAEGETRIRRWSRTLNASLGDLDLPEGATPTALALHATESYLLVSLSDGRLLLWTLLGDDPPETIPSVVPSRNLAFFPGVRDASDLRYVSVDQDDVLRVWRAPGELLASGYEVSIPGGTTTGLSMSNDRSLVAVGTRSGTVRIYNIRTPPNAAEEILQGHGGPVGDVFYTRDQRKLASVDSTGGVRLWRMPDGLLLAEFDSDAPEGSAGPRVALAPPRGRVLTTVLGTGMLELRNGDTGTLYNSLEVVDPAYRLTAVGFSGDGARTFIGDSRGRVSVVRAGLCQPNPETPRCFGGYMVWRSPTPRAEDAVLFRIYNYSDSTWTFDDEDRRFVDPDSIIARENPQIPGDDTPYEPMELSGPANGIPYFYSLVRFDLVYESTGGVFRLDAGGPDAIEKGFFRMEPGGEPVSIAATAAAKETAPYLERVIVVPNPYELGKVPWERAGVPHVEFRNLPLHATDRIYTLGGDLVRVLDHGPGRFGESRDAVAWDFLNDAGRRVTSGVYVYQVETPAGSGKPGEVIQGYFTLVL